MKLFASKSSFSPNQRETVLDLVEWMRQQDHGNVYNFPAQDDNLKVVCCLPYILGFASQEGRIPRSVMNLRKPILILATSHESFSILEKCLSSELVEGNDCPYLCSLGFVTVAQRDQSAYYKTSVIKETCNARTVMRAFGKVDLVLSSADNSAGLRKECFSIVFLFEAQNLTNKEYRIMEDKFSSENLMVVFQDQPVSVNGSLSRESFVGESECLLKCSSPTSTTPLLVRHSYIVNANTINNYLNKSQLNVLNEIVIQLCDTHRINLPVEVSVSKTDGGIGLLCYLPYFLGQSNTFLPQVDLRKPILILAPRPQCLDILKKNLCDTPYLVSNGHLSVADVEGGALYRTYLVEDVYGAATVSRLTGKFEIVMTPSTYYQSLPRGFFSVVIVYGGNYQTTAMESSTMKTFRDSKIIVFKMDARDLEESSTVTRMDPRMSALYQTLGEMALAPRVVRHGGHLKDSYFFNESSLLTESQRMGLSVLVDWFVFSDSANQSVVMNTLLGFEQTAQMVCCLPYMYGWAVGVGYIGETVLDLRFPFLVLGRNKLIRRLGKMIQSAPFFIPSDSLAAFETYSDAICTPYFVKDAENARSLRQNIGHFDIAVSDIELLQHLPGDCFSMVIVFSVNSPLETTMNAVLQKFNEHSKLIFINAQFNIDEVAEQFPSESLPDVLSTFGERVRDRLFHGLSNLSVQELAAVGASVDWFTLPDTSNLPLFVEVGCQSSVDLGKVLSVLPFMLGWANQRSSVPTSEVEVKSSKVLLLASNADTLGYLSPFFHYPYLIKSGILTPELAHLGAYYSAKVLSDQDVWSATKLGNDHSVFISELKHYTQFPPDFASATYVVSREDLDPDIVTRLKEKFASHTKLAFFKTCPIPDTFLLYSGPDDTEQSPLVLRYGVDSLPNNSKIPKLIGVSRREDFAAASLQSKPEETGQLDNGEEDKIDIQHSECLPEDNKPGQYQRHEVLSSTPQKEDGFHNANSREPGSMPHFPIQLTLSTQTDLSMIPSSEIACQTVEHPYLNTHEEIEEGCLQRSKTKSMEANVRDFPRSMDESEALKLRMDVEEPILAGSSVAGLEGKGSYLASDEISQSGEALQMEALATSSYSLTLDKELTLSELLDEMLYVPSDSTKRKRRRLKQKRSVSKRFIPRWIREKIMAWKNRSNWEDTPNGKSINFFKEKLKWPWKENQKTGTVECQTEGEDDQSDELEFDVQVPGSETEVRKINVIVSVHDLRDGSEEEEESKVSCPPRSSGVRSDQEGTPNAPMTPGEHLGEEEIESYRDARDFPVSKSSTSE